MSDLYSQLSTLEQCLEDKLITNKEYSKYRKKVLKNWIKDESNEKPFWKRMYQTACQSLKFFARNLIIPILIHLGLAIATHGASIGYQDKLAPDEGKIRVPRRYLPNWIHSE
ncbi:21368_t:CDS:2 [Gigaspora rosea]|nr:21368_t:CDS:2 [Gigaspora rosea]